MAGASLAYVLISGSPPPFVVVHRMVSGIDSFPLLAVPFFILAGNLMNNAGITTRIYNFALALVGWMKGGLGHVNVLGSVIFAGMSGTAIADAAGLGPIIPPSLPFVIYGMMANASVGALFLAGILPGALMAILMMLTVAYYAHKNGWGADVGFSRSRFGKAIGELAVVVAWPLLLWAVVDRLGAPAQLSVLAGLASLFVLDRIFRFEALLPIMTPVLLIGGMTTGLFTPTEGAIAACVWAMILGFAWYRTLSWRMFVKVCLDTVETTATVLFIVASASIFGWMLTATGVTADLAAWVLAFTKEAWVFLLLANLLMLFVGCFLEPTAAITILVPLLLPIAVQLGVDPIHFGLVMVLNLMIGLLHPPMGMVLFVLARVSGLSFERTTIAILPWLVPLLVSLVIITYLPKLVLWLPRMFF
jgi:TRAP-type C4-dicarboxylate transport system permease large subunit